MKSSPDYRVETDLSDGEDGVVTMTSDWLTYLGLLSSVSIGFPLCAEDRENFLLEVPLFCN